MKKKITLWACFGVFLLVCLALTFVKESYVVSGLKKRCVVYEGKVLEITTGSSMKLSNCFKIKYEWKNSDGNVITSENAHPTGKYSRWLAKSRWEEIGSPKKGDKVTVYFDPKAKESYIYLATSWHNM